MALIAVSNPIAGAVGDLAYAGAPSAGTNEVQTLTIGGTPTSGTFKLAYDGHVTGSITWSATNATLIANVQAALDALNNVGTNGFVAAEGTMTAGIGTITLTAGANLAKKAVNTITVHTNALAGSSPTVAVVETTPGVTATARGSAFGTRLVDTTNSAVYQNTGTALVPVWTADSANSVELNALAAAIPTAAVADLGAVTVGSAIGVFTDPPSAAEMALLRTFVNALKTDAAADRAKINDLLAKLRTAGIITP